MHGVHMSLIELSTMKAATTESIKTSLCFWRRPVLCIALVAIASCISPNAASEAFTPQSLWRHRPRSAVTSWLPHPLTVASKTEPEENGTMETAISVRGGDESPSLWKKKLFREMVAELIGTFFIVLVGTGSVMSAIYTDSLVGLFQIASVWIIAVTVAICTTASISGAHLNPAISIAFAMLRPSKAFGWGKVIPYALAQLLGAVLGSWANFKMYASSIQAFESVNNIVRASEAGIASARAFGEYFVAPVTIQTAFFAEALGTGLLAFVIFALTHEKNEVMKDGFVPPIIGLTVGALIAVIAPLTQAGLNPARDFGPRIVAFLAGWKAVAFKNWWVYVVAPIIGAPIGAAVADKILYAED